MQAIANVLVSDRVKPDPARQVRLWSGTLRDDTDFEEAIVEILPFYAPPGPASATTPASSESADFSGELVFHSTTQNAAFGKNMPRFDVRHQLKNITVRRQSIPG